jgi:lipopolysaccharide export system protein LptA
VLRSEVIVAQMRPGGQELEQVETQTPGVFELTPGVPGQPKRRLEAIRMWVRYAPGNRVESFRAAEVSTRTEGARGSKQGAAPIITESRDLFARFDPASGAMKTMEQWTNFRYQEGDQRAKAERALMDQASNRITLLGKARAWDKQGSVSAETIVMDQAHDQTTAEGGVESTRVGEPEGSGSAMMGGKEPLHARANRMETSAGNSRILYEGADTLWQGANRLEADQIRINRDEQTLEADGNVVNQLVEQPASGKSGKASLTHVRAERLIYSDTDKLAHYTGSVLLKRSGIDVRSKELRAWLDDTDGGESRFDRAFVDGDVRIVQESPGRTRQGQSEHAEYYTEEGKVILSGGNPTIEDSLKGSTSGRKLTYWTNNDSLLVEGAESEPASSRIRRK